MLPCLARGVSVTGRVVGVTEEIESCRVTVAVTQLHLEGDGLLEVVDGPVVLAEEMVGVAEAVQGIGLAPAVTDLSAKRKGLLAMGEGLLGLAEQGVVPAGVVECVCQPSGRANAPEQDRSRSS